MVPQPLESFVASNFLLQTQAALDDRVQDPCINTKPFPLWDGGGAM